MKISQGWKAQYLRPLVCIQLIFPSLREAKMTLEDDSEDDPDFISGAYIPEEKPKKKRGSKGSSAQAQKRRRTDVLSDGDSASSKRQSMASLAFCINFSYFIRFSSEGSPSQPFASIFWSVTRYVMFTYLKLGTN